jgi:hypothetical protein
MKGLLVEINYFLRRLACSIFGHVNASGRFTSLNYMMAAVRTGDGGRRGSDEFIATLLPGLEYL